MAKKIMLLGSGELGKEFVIAVKRLGHHVIAVDSYNDAPAQQVAAAGAVAQFELKFKVILNILLYLCFVV